MLYSTIVEKDESGLQMVIQAAEKFEQGKYINAITECHYTKSKTLAMTEYVKEQIARIKREYFALVDYRQSFIDDYATDNNECYDIAGALFYKIRSCISGSKKIYKSFCVTDRKRMPRTTTQWPSVFKRSGLVNVCNSEDLFGIETYSKCVTELYNQLEEFHKELLKCLILCRNVMIELRNVGNSYERCELIYRNSYEKTRSNIKLMIQLCKEKKMLPKSELEERKKKASSEPDFICSNYHMWNKSQFLMYVLVSELSKDDEMTDLEKELFGADNIEFVKKVRLIIQHFDDFEENAHKGKHNDKHSAYCIASFMLWCGIGNTPDNKVQLFVKYFNITYTGRYPEAKTNAVNNAKNKLMYEPEKSNLDNNLFHAKLNSFVEQNASKDWMPQKNVANL